MLKGGNAVCAVSAHFVLTASLTGCSEEFFFMVQERRSNAGNIPYLSVCTVFSILSAAKDTFLLLAMAKIRLRINARNNNPHDA